VKPRPFIPSIFLLLGALINVAVALGCAAWIDVGAGHYTNIFSASELPFFDCTVWSNVGAVRVYSREVKGRPQWFTQELVRPQLIPAWSRVHSPLPEREIVALEDDEGDYVSVPYLLEPLIEDGRGWPLIALCAEFRIIGHGYPPYSPNGFDLAPSSSERNQLLSVRALPISPFWPGFALNTLFYSGTLWLAIRAPYALRRVVRVRRGQCPACAYPVGPSTVCTECGRSRRLTNRSSCRAARRAIGRPTARRSG
jgi:hypothetical protein